MKKKITAIFLSILTVFGLSLQPDEAGWTFLKPGSFLLLPLFLMTIRAIEWVISTDDSGKKIWAAITAGIFGFCHLLGSVLVKNGTALWLLRNQKTLIPGIICAAGYGTALFLLIFFLYKGLNSRREQPISKKKLPFLLIWLLLIAAWLPWFLNQYPAVMTADTTDQLEMALGLEPLNNHHPVFYTFLLRIFLGLGGLISPLNGNQTGAVLFIAVQMLIISGVFAFVLMLIIRDSTNRLLQVGVLLYGMLYPVHGLYSVTMWKDVPFAVCLMALTALMYCELREHSAKTCIAIAIFGVLLTLFRHNGLYIILLSIPFLPRAYVHHRKGILIAFFSILLFFCFWSKTLLPALHIPEGKAAEALSIPLQQTALTARRQHANMEPEMLEELQSWFNDPEIWEEYSFRISDPVKNVFDDERYRSDPMAFWKFWLKLGITYPQDFLDGLLLHTYGYWYPETPHWVFITGIDDDGLFGIHMNSLWNPAWFASVVQWLSSSGYDQIPLLGLLFSPGACFWLLLTLFAYCLYRKFHGFVLFMPAFILWLTALASPVNCEFRYVYGMFACFPILLTAALNAAPEGSARD